jgi:hypothetical protein
MWLERRLNARVFAGRFIGKLRRLGIEMRPFKEVSPDRLLIRCLALPSQAQAALIASLSADVPVLISA